MFYFLNNRELYTNTSAVSQTGAVGDHSDTRPVVDSQQALSVITRLEDPMLKSCFVSSCSLGLESSPLYA